MKGRIRFYVIMVCVMALSPGFSVFPAMAFDCTDPLGCVTIAPGDPITLGGLTILSGPVEWLGQEHVRGADMALKARQNTILGHPIKLQYEDSACSFEVGANAALKLVANPKLVGIIGPVCSEVGKAASPIMSEAGLVMVATNNLSPELTSVAGEPGELWQPGYFRVSYNGADQGKAGAIFAYKTLGVREVATLGDGTPANQGIIASFEQAFSDLGGEIVYSAQITPGEEDMEPIWTGMTYVEPELLYFVLRVKTGGLALLQQKKQVDGTDSILLLHSDIMYDSKTFEELGEDGVGLYFTPETVFENEAVNTLIADYEAAYGDSPRRPNFAWSYDAVNLLAQAIETAAVTENDGTLHIGRQALRDALYGIQEFKGVTGALSCDQYGDCTSGAFKVVHWDKAGMTFEEIDANVKYRYNPE